MAAMIASNDVSLQQKGAPITEGYVQSFGNLTFVTNSGLQESSTFDIVEDITIGRSAECDVRVRNKSVSRVHAKITIDKENGCCLLENISKTNFTVRNGIPVQTIITLTNGDIISVGDRTFQFNLPQVQLSSDNTINHTMTRHIPTLEKIEEENSGVLSPMVLAEVEKHNNIPASTPVSAKKSAKKSLSAKKAAVGVPYTEASPPAVRKSSSKMALNTPIRQDIKSRLQNYDNQTTDDDKKAIIKAVLALKTPLKDAINSKRKSYGASSATKGKALDASTSMNSPTATPKSTLKMQTPLRRAIEARGSFNQFNREDLLIQARKEREEIEAANNAANAAAVVSHIGPGNKITMNHAILKAIQLRRKSYDNITSPLPKLRTPRKSLGSMKSPGKSRRLPTPLRLAVEQRRKSFSVASGTPKATPVKKSTKASNKKSHGSNDVSSSPLSGRALLMASSHSPHRSDSASPVPDREMSVDKMNPSDVVVAGDDKTQSSVEQYNMSVISATCSQISIDSMTTELQLHGMPVAEAYAEAKEAFLSPSVDNTGDFSIFDEIVSPVRTNASTPKIQANKKHPPLSKSKSPLSSKSHTPVSIVKRGRNSLLNSLEKKGVDAAVSDKMVQVCDLVDALSDEEMGLINKYALHLESCGMDCEEAFALALDAYVRGVERGNLFSPFSPQQDFTIEKKIIDHNIVCDDSCQKEFSNLMNNNSKQANLADMSIVEKYARMIIEDSHVDDAIAYGVALDTFLADPSEFRSRMENLINLEQVHMYTSPFDDDDNVDEASEIYKKLRDEQDDDDLWVPEDYVVATPTPQKVVVATPTVTKMISKAPNTAIRRDVALDYVTNAIKDVITEISSFDAPAITKEAQSVKNEMTISYATEAIHCIIDQLSGEDCETDDFCIFDEIISPVATKKSMVTPSKMVLPNPSSNLKSARKGHSNKKTAQPVSATKRYEIAEKCVSLAIQSVVTDIAEATVALTEITTPTKKANTPFFAKSTKKKTPSSQIMSITRTAFKRKEVATSYVTDALFAVMQELSGEAQKEGSTSASTAISPRSQRKPAITQSPVKALRVASPTSPTTPKASSTIRSNSKMLETPSVNASPKADSQAASLRSPTTGRRLAAKSVMKVAPNSRHSAMQKQQQSTPGTSMMAAASKTTPTTSPLYSSSPKVLTPKKVSTPTPVNSPIPVQKVQSENKKKVATPVSITKNAIIDTPVKSSGGTKRPRKSPSKAAVMALAVPSPAAKPAKRTRKAATTTATVVVSSPSPVKKSTRSKRGAAAVVEIVEETTIAPKRKRGVKTVTSSVKEMVPEIDENEEGMEDALAILCDGCDKEFFCDQVGLTEIPEGDWYCTGCTKKRNTAASKKTKVAKTTTKKVPTTKKAAVAAEEPLTRRSTRSRK